LEHYSQEYQVNARARLSQGDSMSASHSMQPPGMVALLGSGERTAVGRSVVDCLLAALPEPRTVAVLDSPAGFQPNHHQVAVTIADFIKQHVGERRPVPAVIETRRAALGTPAGDAAVRAIAGARFVVAGPGSPSYMVRELVGTPYLAANLQAHRSGAALYFASAASVAVGAYSVPVYEIFKVGEEPRWIPGLDLLCAYGLRLAIVPHWNNGEGGAAFDTRFCYIGQARFEQLRAQLPADVVLLGIDEHTACILDFAADTARVMGKGVVHVLRDGRIVDFGEADPFPLALLRAEGAAAMGQAVAVEAVLPGPAATLDPRIEEAETTPADVPATLVDTLLAIRTDLRAAGQWALADRLRGALGAAGVIVEDTPDGVRWHRADVTDPA
jgi:hypothetical protein